MRILGVALLIACSRTASVPPDAGAAAPMPVVENPPKATPALLVGPRELWAAYEKNEVGADNIYRSRRLTMTAVIGGIRKDAFDKIVVDFEAGGPSIDRHVIEALFGDEWSTRVGEFERGRAVTVECLGAGLRLGRPVLDLCSIPKQPQFEKGMLRLPIKVTSPDFEFECDLHSVTYSFFFKFEHGEWAMAIGDARAHPIITDIRLRPNVPLIGSERRPGLPPGDFVLVEKGNGSALPDYASLGRRDAILYAPFADGGGY